MNYHLHSQGRDLGVFSLDELRRRRQSGELSGAESVWTEGMSEWQPLDAVLSAPIALKSTGSAPPPLPAPNVRRKNNRTLLFVALGAVVLVILGLTVAAVIGFRFFKRAQAELQLGRSDAVEVASKEISVDPKTTLTERDVMKRA